MSLSRSGAAGEQGCFEARFHLAKEDDLEYRRVSALWAEFKSGPAVRYRGRRMGRTRIVPLEVAVLLDGTRIGTSVALSDTIPLDLPPIPLERREGLVFHLRVRVEGRSTGAPETGPPLFSQETWLRWRPSRPDAILRGAPPPPPAPGRRTRILTILAAPLPAVPGDTTLLYLVLAPLDFEEPLYLHQEWEGGGDSVFFRQSERVLPTSPSETTLLFPLAVPPHARSGRVRVELAGEIRNLPIPLLPPPPPPETPTRSSLPPPELTLSGPASPEVGEEGEIRLRIHTRARLSGRVHLSVLISPGHADGETALLDRTLGRVHLEAGESAEYAAEPFAFPPGLWAAVGEVRTDDGETFQIKRYFDLPPFLPEFDPLGETILPAEIEGGSRWGGLVRIEPGEEAILRFPLGDLAREVRPYARTCLPPGFPDRREAEARRSVEPIIRIPVRNRGRKTLFLQRPYLLLEYDPAPGTRLGGVRLSRPSPFAPPREIGILITNPDRYRLPRAVEILCGLQTRALVVPRGEAREVLFPLPPPEKIDGWQELPLRVAGQDTVIRWFVSPETPPSVRLSPFAARVPSDGDAGRTAAGVLLKIELLPGGLDILHDLAVTTGQETQEISVLPFGEEGWLLFRGTSRNGGRIRAQHPPGRVVSEAPLPNAPAFSAPGPVLLFSPRPAEDTPLVGSASSVRVLLYAGETGTAEGSLRLAADGITRGAVGLAPLGAREALLLAVPWTPTRAGEARLLFVAKVGEEILSAQEHRIAASGEGPPGGWTEGFTRPARYRLAGRTDGETPPLPARLAAILLPLRLRLEAVLAETGPRAGTLRREAARAVDRAAREAIAWSAENPLSAAASPENLDALADLAARAAGLAAGARPVPPEAPVRLADELEKTLRILWFGDDIFVDGLGLFRSISLIREGG